MKKALLLLLVLITSTQLYAQPPFWGTIFIDPDIITSADPSSIQSTTYTGQGSVVMYDRRVPGWVTVNAYLFDVVWDDGLTSVAQVNPEFGSVAAATVEAEKYAFLIGQLPTCLRVDVNEIWIHQGVELYGGGNNSILIHTGQSVNYENDGIIEETLVHEACHTSLDATHAAASGWINAQNLDGEFISNYASDNPTTEDIAESYLTWLAVRYRASVLSTADYNSIVQTIPNRLAYFDAMACDLYPLFQNTSVEEQGHESIDTYPNPMTDYVVIAGDRVEQDDIRVFDLLGRDFSSMTTLAGDRLDMSQLPNGQYILWVKNEASKVYKR